MVRKSKLQQEGRTQRGQLSNDRARAIQEIKKKRRKVAEQTAIFKVSGFLTMITLNLRGKAEVKNLAVEEVVF